MVSAIVAVNWAVLTVSLYLAIYYLLLIMDRKERKSGPEKLVDVTVLIPAYNEEKNIRRALESVAGLDYPREKLHIMVIDDGSTDGTFRAAEGFAREHPELDVKVLRNRKNLGKGASLNRALGLVRTPYVVTMDADSFVEEKALREVLKKAKGNAVVAACIFPEKASGVAEKLQEIEYIASNYLAHLLSGFDAQLVAPGPFSLFRTEALREIGGFDETAPAEDLEVVFRLRKRGYSMDFAPEAHVYTEIPPSMTGLIKQRRRWKLGVLDAVEKHPRYAVPVNVFSEQVFFALVFSLSLLMLLGLLAYQLYRKLDSAYIFFRAVGLNILPFLRNLELNFDPYYLDPQTLFYAAFGMVVTTAVLVITFRFFEERKVSLKDVVFYFFLYPGALIMVYLLAFKSWLTRDYKW